jgi:hypothetical protein
LSAIDAVTSVHAARGEERPEVVERAGQRRRAGRVVGAVEQDVSPPVDSSSSRPASARRVARRRAHRGTVAIPASVERVEDASATARWPPGAGPRSPIAVGPSRGSSTSMPSRDIPRIGAGSTIRSGAPIRAARA